MDQPHYDGSEIKGNRSRDWVTSFELPVGGTKGEIVRGCDFEIVAWGTDKTALLLWARLPNEHIQFNSNTLSQCSVVWYAKTPSSDCEAQRIWLADFRFAQLSKEDEEATGGEETEVRREDQDKINRFSRLHQREMNLEDELKAKHVCNYSSLLVAGKHSDLVVVIEGERRPRWCFERARARRWRRTGPVSWKLRKTHKLSKS